MSNASGLTPVNEHLLVELGGQYTNIQVKEGKYDTQETGIVVEAETRPMVINHWPFLSDITGRRIYWAPMKEGTRVQKEGKTYVFVAYADVQGVEGVKAS